MKKIDILSLFPGYFQGPFDESMIKRAKEKGLVDINLVDIRDFAQNKHQRVDDRPYGGGPGMLLAAPPVERAIQSVHSPGARVVYLSPQGKPFKAADARRLSGEEHLVFLCGHYEGVDERVLENWVDEEFSIGDFVLSNGCIAAIAIVDATLRFVPGFLGHGESAETDSFEDGLLGCPQYTRPPEYGSGVPEVLLSGNHGEISAWRMGQREKRTEERRPDLYKKFLSRASEW